ncbi:MAG: tRNA (adenosine(37)-N6)-threonylcarbamoyltransferase complex transferase subunit TsaD [Deltaproteobacteria bacterium RBG_13_43_22]|jgi:N6-L-threonylcarbamoyladenine synthase|nr:MAG: tRNA (adenosine(37)-N6)-threonylcarbamoyltransferase complex transferase subunit TsaD [Deltaproteobacteria bacterium RBG_13_43_22]
MIILGIETSCDETAASVLKDGKEILSNVVYSQIALHRPYGGVVPELASRRHLDNIVPVVEEALAQAGLKLENMEGIAVTRGPGLVGALLVGLCFAKSLCAVNRVPLTGVNHIEGHICSIFLEHEVPFPFLSLTVSGGHTSLFLVKGIGAYEVLGQTRDDAAGEAFDKVAKLLNLGYPGGGIIESLAEKGEPKIRFPRAIPSADSLDFSFSGIKTAVVNYVKGFTTPDSLKKLPTEDIAASFQEAVVDMLIRKVIQARNRFKTERLVLAGGVVSNGYLRRRFQEMARKEEVELFIPSPHICTDNAAMIAWVGNHYLERGKQDSLDIDALSRWRVGVS